MFEERIMALKQGIEFSSKVREMRKAKGTERGAVLANRAHNLGCEAIKADDAAQYHKALQLYIQSLEVSLFISKNERDWMVTRAMALRIAEYRHLGRAEELKLHLVKRRKLMPRSTEPMKSMWK